MGTYYAINTNSDILCHSGVKGMKWGRRRYQNKDGSLTPEGRIHYGKMNDSINNMKTGKNAHKIATALTGASYGINTAMGAPAIARIAAGWKFALATGNPVVIGSAAVGTALGVAGAYGINYATARIGQHAVAGTMNKLHNKKLTEYRKEKFGLKGTDDYTDRTKIKSIKENPKKDTYTVKSKTTGTYLGSTGIERYVDKTKTTNRRHGNSNVSAKMKRTYYGNDGSKESHVKTYKNGLAMKDKVTQNRQAIKNRIAAQGQDGHYDHGSDWAKKHYTIDYKKARQEYIKKQIQPQIETINELNKLKKKKR